MDWLDRMNSALDYIEEHLSEELDYVQVAKMACCSAFHFQRMFPFITGIPLSEYIRRRRLTLAAFELQHSDIKVIDVAIKCGYESSESFSRAFKNLHGVIPISARKKGTALKAYPRMIFHISIKGDVEMNYRIEEKQAFEVFGISTEINSIGDKPYIEIPEYWKKSISNGTIDRIHKDAGISEETQVHAALYNMREGAFSYMICYHVPERDIPDDYARLSVPALTWAIFTTGVYPDGKGDIQSIWKRLWTEWFPTSGYEHTDGPEFEMSYYRGNNLYESEVWIPVIKR